MSAPKHSLILLIAAIILFLGFWIIPHLTDPAQQVFDSVIIGEKAWDVHHRIISHSKFAVGAAVPFPDPHYWFHRSSRHLVIHIDFHAHVVVAKELKPNR